MFTAILVEASEKPSETGLFSYAIVYTDGISIKYEKRYTSDALTDDIIQRTATAEIGKLNASVTAKRTLTPGAEIPLLLPAVPDEKAAERERLVAFLAARRTAAGLQAAAADGLIAADDPQIADAAKNVANLWEISFAPHIAKS